MPSKPLALKVQPLSTSTPIFDVFDIFLFTFVYSNANTDLLLPLDSHFTFIVPLLDYYLGLLQTLKGSYT
ncbi:hypothetical protein AMATHDRAFT_9967 [Amanita thiersii Skay4041]|uniref:Uncharacterized protein n=1 Tax=Amanita thiersii Skay4041 TaxID=703135 RepID=A0A2A9N839_9AGAR|nr:hypothetical protein AMATHDRAFT_9967 [Amanita thiersii Skay4041]